MARENTHILTVINCGASSWARDGRLLGSADLPLSNAGRAAVTETAALLARELKIEPGGKGPIATIRHPQDEAATETAGIVGKAIGAKTRPLDKLNDPHLGLLEGLTEEVFAERYGKRHKQWQQDMLALNPPEGEAIADMRSRLFEAIAKLIRRSRNGETAVVLHDVGVGLLWCWSSNRPTSDLWEAVRTRPPVERLAITPQALESLSAAAMRSPVQQAATSRP